MDPFLWGAQAGTEWLHSDSFTGSVDASFRTVFTASMSSFCFYRSEILCVESLGLHVGQTWIWSRWTSFSHHRAIAEVVFSDQDSFHRKHVNLGHPWEHAHDMEQYHALYAVPRPS